MRSKQLIGTIIFFSLVMLIVSLSTQPFATEKSEKPSVKPTVKPFDSLQKRLIKDGFDEKRIKRLYKQSEIKFETIGVSLFSQHNESSLNYDQYVSKRSIRKAKKYIKRHKANLARVEKAYSVDKEIITAIILVETGLGTLLGNQLVINTFSTTASLSDPEVRNFLWKKLSSAEGADRKKFDEWADRKSKWGYRELKAFLQYAEKNNINPVTIKGSYAGAMGIPQFIPSSVMLHARDGDKDGKVDLFSHADAAASVANFLKNYGWKSDIDNKKASEILYKYNHSKVYVETLLKIYKKLKG